MMRVTVALLLLMSSLLFSSPIKVDVSPEKVIPGYPVRVSFNGEGMVKKAVLYRGKDVVKMKRKRGGIFTTKWTLPKETLPGKLQTKIKVFYKDGRTQYLIVGIVVQGLTASAPEFLLAPEDLALDDPDIVKEVVAIEHQLESLESSVQKIKKSKEEERFMAQKQAVLDQLSQSLHEKEKTLTQKETDLTSKETILGKKEVAVQVQEQALNRYHSDLLDQEKALKKEQAVDERREAVRRITEQIQKQDALIDNQKLVIEREKLVFQLETSRREAVMFVEKKQQLSEDSAALKAMIEALGESLKKKR